MYSHRLSAGGQDMKAIKSLLILTATIATVANCAETQLVVEANNRFALDIYQKLCSSQGNLFCSPYSISTALALAHAGAKGQTEMQMARVLHFPTIDDSNSAQSVMNMDDFASAFGKIIKDLNERAAAGDYELRVANALWGQKGYSFLKEYLELIKSHYEGNLHEVDFVAATESARQTINSWVEEKTNDKIKELIKPGVLDAMTRLVLTNAIYFKGNWQRQFEENKTKDAPFNLLNGQKTDVPMMNQTAEFGYMENKDFQALELPYVENELSMIILLPKQIDGLAPLEQKLTFDNLKTWLGQLHKREVVVSIPKFKITSQFSLASVLKSMGMTDAFSARKADFSGMTGNRDLCISAVIHKAYVDVNEEGTEAAAATAVTMKLTSVGPSHTPVFLADHPFLFLIRDNQSGSILFIGRVTNPGA